MGRYSDLAADEISSLSRIGKALWYFASTLLTRLSQRAQILLSFEQGIRFVVKAVLPWVEVCGMRLCTYGVLIPFVVVLLIWLLPSSIAADGGVGFLSDKELRVVLAPDELTTLEVKVINGSTTSQDIHLDLVGLTNEDRKQILPDALPDALPITISNVAPGDVASFKVRMAYIDGLTGNYVGQVVAYGDDGSLARLALNLIVAEFGREIPIDSIAEPNLLEMITLVGVNWFPSPLAHFDISSVTPMTVPLNTAPSKAKVVGYVSGDNGIWGTVIQDGEILHIEGIDRAGEYAGKVDLRAYDDQDAEIALQVQIRDAILWPLLVLVIGLLISTFLDRYTKVGRPGKQLQIGLARLREKAAHLQDEARKALPEDWPFERDVYRIYDAEACEGLLCEASEWLWQAFCEAHSDEERKKWVSGGAEFQQVEGYVNALPGLFNLCKATVAHYQPLTGQVLKHYPNKNPHEIPVFGQVEEVVRPGLIRSAPQLQRLQESLGVTSAFVADFLELFLRLVSLMNLAEGPQHKQAARNLLDALVSEAVTGGEWLVELDAASKRLELDIKATQLREQEEGLRLLSSRPQETEVALGLWPRRLAISSLPDLRKMLGLLHVEKLSQRTSEDLDRALARLDLAFELIAGTIVVVTGLSVLYLGKASFGSVADYVGVLLWGTAVQEGLKLARELGPGLMQRIVG